MGKIKSNKNIVSEKEYSEIIIAVKNMLQGKFKKSRDKIKMQNPELKDVIGEPKEEETSDETTGEITGEKMTNMRNVEGMRSLF